MFLRIGTKLKWKTMKDYHDLYLKCDLLLLADAFEKFGNNSFKNYGLCPSHYLTAPTLSWDAMFNMTKVELQLIPDPDMYIFFEKVMIGGVCHISNRHSKANNIYLKSYQKVMIGGVCHISNRHSKANNKYLKSYDPKQESEHIIHLGK